MVAVTNQYWGRHPKYSDWDSNPAGNHPSEHWPKEGCTERKRTGKDSPYNSLPCGHKATFDRATPQA